jgi:hypothetical protein
MFLFQRDTLARFKGFPYYGPVNITLSLDEKLVKELRKIAVDRDTTLTGIVRDHLEKLAAENATTGKRKRQREALEHTFERLQFNISARTWTRADLHARR